MTEEAPAVDDLELLDLLLAEEGAGRPALPPRPAGAPPSLSRAQRRLWFLHQLAPMSPAYGMLTAVRLTGRLDPEALCRALREVMRRHEALRCCFPEIEGRPGVVLREEAAPEIRIDDLAGMEPHRQEAELARLCEAEARRPFDLAAGPLLRLRLLRLAEREHVAVLSLHHILADGWSMGVLLDELGQIYGAFRAGRPSPLPPLALQYGDAVALQEGWLAGEAAREQRRWWVERLAGLPVLDLPTDHPRPAEPSQRGAVQALALPNAVAEALREIGQREGATPTMTLLAGFAVLLHRYTGQEDIAIGLPAANRGRRELEPLIGLFVNSLVIRCDLSGRPSFLELLQRVRDFTAEALARQELPFEELVGALAPDRDLSGNPLFQVMVTLEPAPAHPPALPELAMAPLAVATGVAKFDLLLAIAETAAGGLTAGLEYATDLFEPATAARMAGHLGTLLAGIAADPSAPVGTLPLLTPAERRQLEAWNRTATPYPREAGLAALFELQVRQRPEAMALGFGAERLSYAALDARANRLARRLRDCGVGAETPVAIHAGRSAALVVGMLAIIKAGGAYVPLDPAHPRQRLALMLEDCGAPVLLAEQALLDLWPDAPCRLLPLEEPPDATGQADAAPDWPAAGGGSLAYIMYTSGSTGRPKGVAVPQRGVSRLVLRTNYVEFRPEDAVAQASNASFDAATFEIWGALLNGARLVGLEREVVLDPPRLAACLRERGITTLFLTPALFSGVARAAPDAFRGLRNLVVGGDRLEPEAARAVLRHGPPERLVNGYGPTENTTFSTWKLVREVPPGAASVPIGVAVSNTRLHVLDAGLQPVPVGVPGELHLGGDGLARGYHRRPEATAAAFIPDPFEPGARLYRTGDIVRRLPDGDLEFLGRRDGQVKIRGFRVEPGEVEAALLRQPGLREAVVIAREDQPGRRELVAYVVGAPGQAPDPAALRAALAAQLTGYMLPAAILSLPALPLNANGKLDRQALPAPGAGEARAEAARPPADPREASLAAVWAEVLGRPGLGVQDHYFELGGDSITAIQVASRLRRLGWELRVADLFRHPRIAELAPHLRPAGGEVPEPEAAGEVPFTPVQRWFLAQYAAASHFNQALLLRPAAPLAEAPLRGALAALAERHDALRLRLLGEGEGLRQVVLPVGEAPELAVHDLRAEADPAAAMERQSEAIQRGLDLRHGPLLRAALFRLAEGERLLLVIHHLAVDAVSWRILLEELELAYAQAAAGEAVALGPPGCSFRRWAATLAGFAASPELAAEAAYWDAVEAAPVARLPLAEAGPGALRHGEAETLSTALSAEDTAALLTRAPRAHGTEIMDLLLTALGRALRAWGGGEAHRITLEGHGREPPDEALDLSRSVGWFTSLYPFLLAPAGEGIGPEIEAVKTALRRVPRKGLGHGILRQLAGRAGPAGTAPQLSFNYLGQFEEGAEGFFRVAGEPCGRAVAPHLPRAHALDLVGLVSGGRLLLSLEFAPAMLARDAAAALLEELRRQLGAVVRHCIEAPAPPALAGEVEETYPLSPLQEGMLFQSLLEPDAESYLVQVRFQAAGALDVEAFRQAWHGLCRRHAVLRSAFLHGDRPRPVQAVLRDRPPEFLTADLHHLPAPERAAHLEEFCRAERRRGFDLRQDPLLRVAVFREAEDAWQILWTYHHILIDGWCLAILQRDLLELYAAGREARPPRLPPVVPYRAYIHWLGTRDHEAARRFWRRRLEGYEHPATLPRTALPATGQPRALGEETLVLDAAASAGLAGLAARLGVTLNTVMQGLWGLLLSRYNNREDVVFGTILSGRPAELPGVEEMVGLFITAVPVRVVARPEIGFAALLRELQEAALAAEPHAHLPLAEIQAETALGRALFDHMLVFENYPLRAAGDPVAGGTGVVFTPVAAHDPTHYGLDLTVAPGERITVKFTFDLGLHRQAQIRRVAAHLRMAAAALLHDPDQPLGEVAILPEAEAALLRGFNATAADYPRDRSVTDLFEAEAARRPDAIALRCGDLTMSYRALNRAANRLAHHLRGLGVGAEVPVGLCVERGAEMVVGPLAILKAGGVFVPLSPDLPGERLGTMLAEAGIALLLTRRELAAHLPAGAARLVLLDAEEGIAAGPEGDPPSEAAAGQTAYVTFTSGSTGRPKAVAVAHGGLANMAHAWREAYGLGDPPPRLLQMASFAFDVFMGDLVRALTNGGTLVVCPTEAIADPPALHRLITGERITILESTPALAWPLLEHIHRHGLPLGDLRTLVIGADLLPGWQFRTLLERFGGRLRLLNSYGVTEATIDSSLFETEDPAALDPAAATPIGRPLRNTRLHVLDRLGRPQPLDVPGELHIGGDGLALGYLNRPELTAERFIAAPALGEARLYRTGDLARWRADGNLEFLGRIDGQVKIRGQRIELGEIEHALRRCEGVTQAVVMAREGGAGPELVAYVVAGADLDPGRLRAALGRTLPESMIPARFVPLDRLPLSPNGKLDRRALPDPEQAAEQGAAPLPPRTATEATLAALWREVLQVAEIGRGEDFFALGGHSLKAMQITARIHQELGVRVPLRAFFGHPSIEALAGLVEASARAEDWARIPPASPKEHYALSHAQRRLWMLHGMDGAAAYNMPEAYVIEAEVDAALLDQAFRALIRRHEALRTAFAPVDGEPRQRILAELPFAVAVHDLRGVAEAERRGREIADRDANTPFDLAAPPLLRASLAHLPGRRSLLVLTMHHIIGDGWSGNLVWRELLALYDAFRQGRPDPLRPLRIQYKDFAAWQAARGFGRQEAYWLDRLAGMPERVALPYDMAPEPGRDFTGGNLSVTLEAGVAAGLRRLAAARGTTLSAVLLALFNLHLFQWTRQEDLCIGMSTANRSHPDTESLIGFFVNILPIRCRLAAEMEFDELLALVAERSGEALEHQDYPFDLMIERLNPARQANRQPLVNVIYAFQNFTDVHVGVEREGGVPERPQPGVEIGWQGFDLSFATSKFDLTLFASEEPESIRLTLEYDSALFLPETIREQLRIIAEFAGMVAGEGEGGP